MKSEDKAALDIERGRWASICGTSYYYVGDENRMPKIFDEAPFYIKCENPVNTFVVYYADDNTPAYSVQITRVDNRNAYNVYTPKQFFFIQEGEIKSQGENGNDMIPVIEYPNNERRLSDIEITITITDGINNLQSDRINAVEQFVQAFILFKNCKLDEQTFKDLAFAGALSIKDTADGKTADAKMMTSELSQDGTQVTKDDLYNSLLEIQGMPSREEASGSDTGQAAALRNGYYAEEKRAELRIPIFQKSERMMLRVVLNKLRVKSVGFALSISDIDIRPNRSKLENMMVKAQVLQILHQIGVDDAVALKTINLFSDVQDVIVKSADRMQAQFESSINKGTNEVANGDTEI
jgi:SPP1 family phage portal protein